MKKIFCILIFYGCFATLLSAVYAQGPAWLVGTWQTRVVSTEGMITDYPIASIYVITFNADGSYKMEEHAEEVESVYLVESGTWQLTGTTLAQQWYDTMFGEKQELMELDILDDNHFKISGTDSVFTRTSTLAPEHSLAQTQNTNPLSNADSSQEAAKLFGPWYAESQGCTVLMTMNEDGSYTFNIPCNSYSEQGTWQFDGTNYSQQWLGNTGTYTAATYKLEFTSENLFVMSGGNFNAPMTFSKGTPPETVTNPLSTLPQLPAVSGPPKAGDYSCTVMTVGLNGSTTTIYSPITGTTLMQVPSPMVMPSVMGTLNLDGNGTYTVSGFNEQGTYSFDDATKQVTFTGFLASLPVSYGENIFVFTYSDSEGSDNHTCSRLSN